MTVLYPRAFVRKKKPKTVPHLKLLPPPVVVPAPVERHWPTPQPGMYRDACTCDLPRRPISMAGTQRLEELCWVCQAWEDGYVLVGGQRRYLRAMWIIVNRIEEPVGHD